ncbi:MAG: serine hydrolase [Desulfobulbaceae bacterium]|nr:serine hydrolase [Desulfobulbaceae bacterium]
MKSLLSLTLSFAILALAFFSTELHAAKNKEKYDIIYLLSKDLERVLDYQEELEAVFDKRVKRKLKVMGRGDEYALIYDGNDSARTVSKTLIQHADLLNKAGFDEPYATKEQDFHVLFNVSYGMGKNLDPLKKKYGVLYNSLGEEVKQDLFIEKTDYGNYILVYRHRGSRKATTLIARKHAKILKSKRISTSVSKESNNTIVYGESSLINDGTNGNSVDTQVIAGKSPGKTKNKVASAAKIKKSKKVNNKSSLKKSSGNYTKFEQSIEEYIEKLRRKGKIAKDESTGWMVYDLAKDKSIVDINANKEFQAASMIKPFIALAFFHQVKQGKFKYGPKSRRKMEAMIQRSNNAATNWVMRQAGGPAKCDAILRKHYARIFKNTEIREYIPAGGRTYLNSAPPSDYVRFLRALWNKELPRNREIRRLMALPGRDRIYNGTPIPKGTLVYNKTGSTAHLCGDMGILVPKTKRGGRYPYVIVGIIERRSRPSDYGRWMDSRSRVIRQVSTLVYKQMKREHQLR